MSKYWIAVASFEHVQKGVAGGFAQVCHGKASPLERMSKGDWIIYYSPTISFQGKDRCQSFTEIGKIQAGEPYTYAMSHDFIPTRRDVSFIASKQTSIEPLLERLSFIKDKKRWGFPFRRGCFAISFDDFIQIATAMGAV